MSMTAEQVNAVARTAAREAVVEVLMLIGIDTRDPIKAQQTSAVVREMVDAFQTEEFQKDMIHLRTWRVNMEQATNKGILAIVGLLVTGIGSMVVMGFKGWVKGVGG